MRRLLWFLLTLVFHKKEELEMIAMFWAQRILLGKKTFSDVPVKLKDKVRELLIESDMEELATEG